MYMEAVIHVVTQSLLNAYTNYVQLLTIEGNHNMIITEQHTHTCKGDTINDAMV